MGDRPWPVSAQATEHDDEARDVTRRQIARFPHRRIIVPSLIPHRLDYDTTTTSTNPNIHTHKKHTFSQNDRHRMDRLPTWLRGLWAETNTTCIPIN